MVFHVGFYLYGEVGWVYNSATKQHTQISIRTTYNEKSYFIQVLRLIVCQIQGELGNICFCWNHNYGENIKSDLINTAKNFGFAEVKIIEERYVKCRNALEKAAFKPDLNGTLIIDKNVFTVWFCRDSKFWIANEVKVDKELTEDVLLETQKTLKYGPSFVAYYYYDSDGNHDKVIRVLLQKAYPKAVVFFTQNTTSYGGSQMYCEWALEEAVGDESLKLNKALTKNVSDEILSDYDVIEMEELDDSN